MVDREAREKLAELVAGIADGTVSVEDAAASLPGRSSDRAVRDMSDHIRMMAEEPCLEQSGIRRRYLCAKSELYYRNNSSRILDFLRSGQDYRWGSESNIPWWGIPLGAVAVVLGMFAMFDLATWLQELAVRWGIEENIGTYHFVLTIVAVAVIAYVVDFLLPKLRKRDESAWPFYTQADLRRADSAAGR